MKRLAMVLALFWAGAAQAADNVLVVAGGCFWCVEADFEGVPGVGDVVSGYTGGTLANPTYKQVTRGGTGHYEAVQIPFDPSVISREKLLQMFLRSIDVTDAGGQFCDRGESYRSAIFVSDTAEKALADRMVAEAEAELGFKVVTPVITAAPFYLAEAYHQDYYKGADIVLTRFGPISQSKAYKNYRNACGRDSQVKRIWGKSAPFVN